MSGTERPAEPANEKEYVWPQVDPENAALVADVLVGWQRHERPNQANPSVELVAEALYLWARASSNAARALADHAASIRGFREGRDLTSDQPEDVASS